MTLPVPNDLAEEIAGRIAAGQYKSEEEVVRAAFDALRSRDTELAAIQEGIDAMEAGDTQCLEDFDAEMCAKYGWSAQD